MYPACNCPVRRTREEGRQKEKRKKRERKKKKEKGKANTAINKTQVAIHKRNRKNEGESPARCRVFMYSMGEPPAKLERKLGGAKCASCDGLVSTPNTPVQLERRPWLASAIGIVVKTESNYDITDSKESAPNHSYFFHFFTPYIPRSIAPSR